jgi:hypothetical protein
VVQGGEGLDPGGEELIHQPVIEVQPLLIRLAGALGGDPRPGDREPVGGHPDVLHQGDVFPVAVVVVIADEDEVDVVDMLAPSWSGGVSMILP